MERYMTGMLRILWAQLESGLGTSDGLDLHEDHRYDQDDPNQDAPGSWDTAILQSRQSEANYHPPKDEFDAIQDHIGA